MTNVFKSWHSLSGALGLNIMHYCPSEYHQDTQSVTYTDQLTEHYDVVITDAWPKNFSDSNYCLPDEYLRDISSPMVLPTPPVTVGNELKQPLSDTKNFVGYEQKALLLPIQIAIVSYLLSKA